MRGKILILLSFLFWEVHATALYPGLTEDISFEPTTGEYGPTWSTDNPTLQLSSVGFLCHVTAQAYFGGTATVTCTYKDQIGTSVNTRTRNWTFSCVDTKISISPTSKSLKVDESFQLSWNFDRTTYITPSIQFTGYDSNVISVSNNGLVTAKDNGSTKIYVKSNIGTNSAICTVSVNSENTSVSAATSYDEWDSSNAKIITLEEAGTLSDYISSSEKYKITNLTINGPLNGSDLRLLREMCGLDENKHPTEGQLAVIDLKNAVFVTGGPWYLDHFTYLYTGHSDNMPAYSFAWMKNLKKIRFPKYCTELTDNSLLQCQSLEYVAIPPGVKLLDEKSFNGGYKDMPMSSLCLPSSLEKFDASFYECGNLTDVYCYAVNPPIVKDENSFKTQTNFSNGTLFVPKGSANAYWRANGWRCFKEIKETLDIFRTLSINVGKNGVVKFNGNEISQRYDNMLSGRQAFEIKDGENITIEIIPDPGYAIYTIYCNDTLSEIPTNGLFQLDSMNIPIELYIYFKEAASIDDIFKDNITSKIEVFNLQGVLVKNIISRGEIESLPEGIYIVKEGNKVYKFLHQ